MGQCPNMTKMELINLFNLTDRPFVNVHITCNSTAATRRQITSPRAQPGCLGSPLGFQEANVKRRHLNPEKHT